MKKIILGCLSLITLILVGGFFISNIFADPDIPSVNDALNRCFAAKNSSSEQSITDFYCPQGGQSQESIAYQVVLDIEFKKIDKKVNDWFQKLSSPESKGKTPAELSKDILEVFGTASGTGFTSQYYALCNGVIVNEVANYLKNLSTTNDITTVISGNTECNALVAKKLAVYQDAAWSIATKNIVQNYTSDKKTYIDKANDEFDNLLSKFMIYVGKLSEIKDKWDQKTPKTQ